MEKTSVYFEIAGKKNTEATLKLAQVRANELGIEYVIIASETGFTARKALNVLRDVPMTLVVVGDKREKFSAEVIKELERRGHHVLFSDEVSYEYPNLAITVFRRFCEGMKVAAEISMIAVDSGIVPSGKEVIVIAGTGPAGYKRGGGADTAIVMEPLRSRELFELERQKDDRRKIKEVICKPR